MKTYAAYLVYMKAHKVVCISSQSFKKITLYFPWDKSRCSFHSAQKAWPEKKQVMAAFSKDDETSWEDIFQPFTTWLNKVTTRDITPVTSNVPDILLPVEEIFGIHTDHKLKFDRHISEICDSNLIVMIRVT